MEIRTDLPFTHCEDCPEFILSVDDKVLFYGGFDHTHTQRVINVRCKNAQKCIRLNKILKEVGTDE